MRVLRAGDVAVAAEAAVALTVAAVAIRLLPFRTLVRTMGRFQPAGGTRDGQEAAAHVRLAIDRASRRLPWRLVCFQRGLAAHWMLRRRGLPSKLHYGLRQGDDALSAHVWVTLGETAVIGEESDHQHVPVATFPRG